MDQKQSGHFPHWYKLYHSLDTPTSHRYIHPDCNQNSNPKEHNLSVTRRQHHPKRRHHFIHNSQVPDFAHLHCYWCIHCNIRLPLLGSTTTNQIINPPSINIVGGFAIKNIPLSKPQNPCHRHITIQSLYDDSL